jgi:hypothetical protein
MKGLPWSLPVKNSLKVIIPDAYRTSHEEHIRSGNRKILEYMTAGKLPDWEVPGMITKVLYYNQCADEG